MNRRKHRRTARRFAFAILAPLAAVLCLLALAGPVLAAPETPKVTAGHGTVSASYFTSPSSMYFTPAFEYGLTDRLAVGVLASGGRYEDSRLGTVTDRRTNLTLKYELNPNLALEAFTEHGWDSLSSGTMNGFGLFAGQRFGKLYASLRARAQEVPFYGTYRWFDQLTAAGSYALTPQVNLLGTATALLDVGTTWSGSYGLEWQVNRELALYVNRFTNSDATELGAEYRF